jgi:hypothetical protein
MATGDQAMVIRAMVARATVVRQMVEWAITAAAGRLTSGRATDNLPTPGMGIIGVATHVTDTCVALAPVMLESITTTIAMARTASITAEWPAGSTKAAVLTPDRTVITPIMATSTPARTAQWRRSMGTANSGRALVARVIAVRKGAASTIRHADRTDGVDPTVSDLRRAMVLDRVPNGCDRTIIVVRRRVAKMKTIDV